MANSRHLTAAALLLCLVQGPAADAQGAVPSLEELEARLIEEERRLDTDPGAASAGKPTPPKATKPPKAQPDALRNGAATMPPPQPDAPAPRKAAAHEMRVAGDGVLEQVRSGLEWARRDNGSAVGRAAAEQYCRGLGTAGGGWRLPSAGELRSLVDPSRPGSCGGHICNVSAKFQLTSFWAWSADAGDARSAWLVNLRNGTRDSYKLKGSGLTRAMCVRSP